MKSLTAMVQPLRHRLGAHARHRVLAIGDSHVRIFEHWWFMLTCPRTYFEVVYVLGGTATGIRNRNSKTNAYCRFLEVLARGQHSMVVLNLGEVDTAHAIWVRAERHGASVETMLTEAVENFCGFIDEVAEEHELVVLSAPLPTVADQQSHQDTPVRARAAVTATQQERTQLTLEFNRRVRAHCLESGVDYVSADEVALGPDGIVRSDWVDSHRVDHHYARFPYARWLSTVLRPILQRSQRRPVASPVTT